VQAHAQQLCIEHEETPWWNKLTDQQATSIAQLHEPLRHEVGLEAESIPMVDVATTQAQSKAAAPSDNHEGGQTEATMAKPSSASPPPTADGVDKLYHQLAEIHAITIVQLVECTHWRWSDPTSNLVHTMADWQRHAVEPFAERMAPPPPIDFSP
jgi:hypothetical protein